MSFKGTYSEEELVEHLKQKNDQAYSYLFNNYSTSLYGVVKQIVGDGELSNDVLQEVFFNIWRRIDSYDSTKGRLYTWMLNIARNAAIDKVRSKDFQQGLMQQPMSNNEYAHPVIRLGIDDFGLKKVISQLKPEQRLLIDLSYFQGYTHEQIAKAMNMPLGTVKTRLRTALVQLRTLLK